MTSDATHLITDSANFLLLNGPNLNLLGSREPNTYGDTDLNSVEQELTELANSKGVLLSAFQSNHEGELVDKIHEAKEQRVDFILFNPAAYTHTSVALRDALLATEIPFIEIHLSNTYAREEFRQHSFFSDIAAGVIMGLGVLGYQLALEAAIKLTNISRISDPLTVKH